MPKKPNAKTELDYWTATIREAGPLAAWIMVYGFADADGELQDDVYAFCQGSELFPDELFPKVKDVVERAFAVGIAVGQRLRPGAFDVRGGER